MRVVVSFVWLAVLGCNLEKGKCLEACKIDHQSADTSCEASDDPPACKKKAAEAKDACTKKCK